MTASTLALGRAFEFLCDGPDAGGAAPGGPRPDAGARADRTHRVSLDQGIETMRKTGLDRNSKYRETALGGLAVRVVEC